MGAAAALLPTVRVREPAVESNLGDERLNPRFSNRHARYSLCRDDVAVDRREQHLAAKNKVPG